VLTEEDIIAYALTLDGACIRHPYGDIPLVLATEDKHEFCELYVGTSPLHAVIKCDAAKAVELREKYPESILPGYRCNKKYWNSVYIDQRLSDDLVKELLKDGYTIASKMSKRKKTAKTNGSPAVIPEAPKEEFEF